MEKFQEKDLPLRGMLRLQKKGPQADAYIASCKPIWEQAIADGKLRNGTVFAIEDQIFVYYESTVTFHLEEYLPEIADYVFQWPGQAELRSYVPMMKYYQSLPMEEVADWKRLPGTVPTLSVSRMDIDKLQSYIFYHYQLQESRPGGNGRYLGIWGSEDWCVLYNQKNPEQPVQTQYKGKTSSFDCPDGCWREYMVPHFYTWPDGELYQQAAILLHVQE